MNSFTLERAAPAAADLLKTEDVAAMLAIAPREASHLALALVADADIARDLAAELLDRHADAVETLEQVAMNASARCEYQDGMPIVSYEFDATTRRCVLLIAALKLIADSREVRSAA